MDIEPQMTLVPGAMRTSWRGEVRDTRWFAVVSSCCDTLLLLAITASIGGCTASRTAPLDQYLDDLEANGEFSGVVLVAERGHVLFERAAGATESGQRYTPDVTFPIASIAKTLTATALLQLIEADAVRLDQPVAEILDGFPYSTITLRHLLSHSSGLPPYNTFFAQVLSDHPDTVFTNADFLAGVRANPAALLYVPGSASNYDNVNYLVLALVIERVSGMSYQEYMAEHVLGPAAMSQTRLIPLADLLSDSTAESVAIPRIYPHIYSGMPVSASSIPYIISYWNAYRFIGFGDYVSTARDLLRFDRALAEGRLLKSAVLDDAYSPVRLTDGTPNSGHFGLAWQINRDTALGQVVSHTGASVGLSTVLIRNLSRDQVIIVFDNGHYVAEEVGFALLRLLNGDSISPYRRSLARQLGRTLVSEGAERALEEFQRLRSDTASWHVTEDDINALGYDFMGSPGPYRLPVNHRYDDAIVIFKLNTELYPSSWNVWDSYGEALAAVGRRDEAIAMYRKALQLNPQSEVSRRMLQQLLDGNVAR